MLYKPTYILRMTNAAEAQASSTKCLRCGRSLRASRSVSDGVGRTCKAKIAAAAKTTTAKPAQVAKAVELIELAAIVPLASHRRARVFRTVSSDGTRTYLTTAHNCNCAAGLKSRNECCHMLAAQFVTAA